VARFAAAQDRSIGIHLTKWISTHGYALNVDLDPAPFTEWITACGLDGYAFTSLARELGRPLSWNRFSPPRRGAGRVFGFCSTPSVVRSSNAHGAGGCVHLGADGPPRSFAAARQQRLAVVRDRDRTEVRLAHEALVGRVPGERDQRPQ